jgi:cytochrome b subunit of formate dehydrogenase
MTEEQEDKRPLPLDKYLEHRQSLQQTLHDQARSLDKGILTLSSGALGLSIAFIDKIAPHPVCWTKGVLAASWVLFAFAVLSTLFSFLTSQASHRRLIEEWDFTWSNQKEPEGHAKDYADVLTRCLNVASVLLFFAGVFALVIFAIGNL